jgi:hypothetical protein
MSCRYAECHYDKCRGAMLFAPINQINRQIQFNYPSADIFHPGANVIKLFTLVIYEFL